MNTGRRFSCQLAGFSILYSLFPDDHGATLRADPDLVLSPCCHVYTLAHGVRFLGRALVLGIGYGEAAFRDEVRRQSPVAVRGVVGARGVCPGEDLLETPRLDLCLGAHILRWVCHGG